MDTSATAQDDGSARERILRSALELFNELGYHGTPVRALAQAVGIEVASLYYHFPSKQDILFALFERTMDALLAGLGAAIGSADAPALQLSAAVRFHVMFHIARQQEAFFSHSEIRALTAPNRARIVARRDRYEQQLRQLLDAGVRSGVFDIADVNLASTAILVMCSGVSDWFRAQGRLSADQVADHYAALVLRLVGAPRGR